MSGWTMNFFLFMARAEVYQLTETAIEPVSYRNTEHFRLTQQFVNDTERMLKYLFDDTHNE